MRVAYTHYQAPDCSEVEVELSKNTDGTFNLSVWANKGGDIIVIADLDYSDEKQARKHFSLFKKSLSTIFNIAGNKFEFEPKNRGYDE